MWRGVGCVVILAFTVGAYFLAGALLDLYQAKPFTPVRIPPDLGFTVGPIDIPAGIASADASQPARGRVVTVGPVALKVATVKFFVSWMQLAMVAVVDVVIYGLIVAVYSMVNPVKLGPTDAPPVRPKKGRSKSLIR
jgi:hypothetical protein